jgi:hypothetical protein
MSEVVMPVYAGLFGRRRRMFRRRPPQSPEGPWPRRITLTFFALLAITLVVLGVRDSLK